MARAQISPSAVTNAVANGFDPSLLIRVLYGGITEELLFTSYQLAGSTRRWAEDAGFRFLAKTGSPICYHMVFANEK